MRSHHFPFLKVRVLVVYCHSRPLLSDWLVSYSSFLCLLWFAEEVYLMSPEAATQATRRLWRWTRKGSREATGFGEPKKEEQREVRCTLIQLSLLSQSLQHTTVGNNQRIEDDQFLKFPPLPWLTSTLITVEDFLQHCFKRSNSELTDLGCALLKVASNTLFQDRPLGPKTSLVRFFLNTRYTWQKAG